MRKEKVEERNGEKKKSWFVERENCEEGKRECKKKGENVGPTKSPSPRK